MFDSMEAEEVKLEGEVTRLGDLKKDALKQIKQASSKLKSQKPDDIQPVPVN